MSDPNHVYFVAYDHPSGVGNVEQGLEHPITGIEDIRLLEKHLRESNNFEWVVISNWKELERWKGKPQ